MKGEGPADAAVGAEKAVPTMSPGDKFGDSTIGLIFPITSSIIQSGVEAPAVKPTT